MGSFVRREDRGGALGLRAASEHSFQIPEVSYCKGVQLPNELRHPGASHCLENKFQTAHQACKALPMWFSKSLKIHINAWPDPVPTPGVWA